MPPAHARAAADDPWDLFDNAACGQLVTTMSGLVTRVNQWFLSWTGYHAEELVGRKTFSDLLTAGGRIYHETHYAPLLHMQGSAREIAVEIVAADGRRLPALVNALVARGDSGEPQSVRIAIFGAGDRREYERELVRARRRAEESEARARELAETLQASLIPPTPPEIPGLDVGAAFRPAGTGAEIGGDFYDVFELTDGTWGVVIGDVCGKGARAAAITALARYTLRAAAMQASNPRDVLALLNQAMLHQHVETFCTVAFSRVTTGDDRARVAISAGGHPLPIYVPHDAPPRPAGIPGTVIGVIDDPELHDHTETLAPGDGLVFFTDGITEARRGDLFFGDDRLAALLGATTHLAAGDVAERVVEEVVGFQGGFARDDIALVVLKVPLSPESS